MTMTPSQSSTMSERILCSRRISHSDLSDHHSSDTESECPPPPRKKLKKSVQFSSSVSLRCFYTNSSSLPLWLKEDEVDEMKSNAKRLAKLHCHVRSIVNSSTTKKARTLKSSTTITGHTARYQIKGESLRGMEHITESSSTRKRRRKQKEEAMSSVVTEQQAQLIEHVLNSSSVNQAISEAALKIDTEKLAEVYGSKTKESLRYARDVGREDAEIAAEILAEDKLIPKKPHQQKPLSQSQSSQPRRSSKAGKNANIISADDLPTCIRFYGMA